jgi:hypothetical protein
MAVELHVLFAGKLPSKAALTHAMKEWGFPVSIPAGGGALEQHGGFLPMRLRGQKSGVEFDVYDDRAHVEEVAGERFDPRFERLASFRWGSDEDEMLCALCAAAALAKLVDGVVLDEEGSLSVEQAIEQARGTLDLVKPPDPRYGTRPADIKRYLKPLLELRSDLVVVGRMLLIRPVRHFLRGVLFDARDKYEFRLYRAIDPLYETPQIDDWNGRIREGAWKVWQPHFAPLLLDVLATDIFEPWGQVITLEGFAAGTIAHLGGRTTWQTILALILAGEHEQAAEYERQLEDATPYEEEKVRRRTRWEQVTSDIGSLCARLHAREAEIVRALKLEHIWERSPFPVEVPAAERGGRSAEPVFSTTPWVPRPSWLWQEAPTQAGEVRFAKYHVRSDHGVTLMVTLSREEAEERHREREDYAMAVRLPDGLLLAISCDMGWDRAKPEGFPYLPGPSPFASYLIELHGASHFAVLHASERKDPRVLEFWSIEAFEQLGPGSTWLCNVIIREDEKGIHDSRSGKKVYARTPLSPTERELALCPIPAFGEYVAFAERACALLRCLGYGDIT